MASWLLELTRNRDDKVNEGGLWSGSLFLSYR